MEQDYGQAGTEAQIHENQSPPVHHVQRIHQADQREHDTLERNQGCRGVNHKNGIAQLCFVAHKNPCRHGTEQQQKNRGSHRDSKRVQQGTDEIQLHKSFRVILQRKCVRIGKCQNIQIDVFQRLKGIAQQDQNG